MPPELLLTFAEQGGVASYEQIVARIGRWHLHRLLESKQLVKIWPAIYSLGQPDTVTKLHGLDLRCDETVVACMHTAAEAFSFSTETPSGLHVVNPLGHQLRSGPGLIVHRREGAPTTVHLGRPLTTPAWTAIEIARTLRRPRALATLDAAVRSRSCTVEDLLSAAEQQAGRRGIVAARELIPLARPGAESPMESEARLVMIDGGLPEPVLQYELIDYDGRCWRLDFAWPEHKFYVEYDGFEFHASPDALRHDRQKRAALQELRWRGMAIVADDVRRQPASMVRRIDAALTR